MQPADIEGRNALHQSAEEFLQRRSLRIEIHEHETLPGFNAYGDQTTPSAIEGFHALEFRHAFESSVESVFPAVVRTLQHRGLTASLRDHCGGMVTADVKESPQYAVTSAHNNDRLSGKTRGNKFSRLVQLVRARSELPRSAKDVEPLQFPNARIDIPGRGDRGGLRERGPIVVAGKNLLN